MNWLLLRGLTREQAHWGQFPDSLRRLHGGSAVACLDLPGCGTEHARRSPANLEAITDDLRARWLKRPEAERRRFGILGISMGGMIAIDWCHRFPEDFESLVLVNSSAANLSPPHERIRPVALAHLPRLLMNRNLEERERKILELTTRLPAERIRELAREYAEVARSRPVLRGTLAIQLWAASRFRCPKPLRAPVLVVSGARDLFTSPSCSRHLSEQLGARLIVHPDAGHDLPLEYPEWLADSLPRLAAARQRQV